MDDELNAAYRTATQTWANKQALVDSQRKWIEDTDQCSTEGCIAIAYRARIAELDGSDAEEGDNDNVDDTSPPAAPQQDVGQARAGGLDDIVNRVNRAGREADEKPSTVAPYFSTVDEFGSFYAGIKQGERLDGQRLSAGLERMIVASGGQFMPDDGKTPDNCRRRLVEYSPQMLLDFIQYKKSEVSNQPPTFFVQASEDAATPLSDSLGDLKNYMNQTWPEPGCPRNAQLLDTVLKDLGRAADSANETVRASLKAAYAAQLDRDKKLQAEQDAAAEKRAEEQRAEQARQDEEKRQAVAKQLEQERKEIEERQKKEAEKKATRLGG